MTRQAILVLSVFALGGCAHESPDFDSDADSVNAADQSSDEGGGAADRFLNARFVAGSLAIGAPISASFPAGATYNSYLFTIAGAQSSTVTLGSTDGKSAVQLNIYGPLSARGWPSTPVASKVGRLLRGRASASYTFTPRSAGTYLAVVVRHSSSVSGRCVDNCPYAYTIALTCRACGVSCGGFAGGVCPIGASCPSSGGPGSQPAGICLPTPARVRLEANDVSILWPLPPDSADGRFPTGYLKLFPAAGERGPALPAPALELYSGGFHGDLTRSAVDPFVIISALRVDPCAPRTTGACVPELRVSAQPFRQGLDDAATHLIYELAPADFQALRAELLRLKQESPVSTSGRLRVHPGLQAAGMSSAFARHVGDVLIRFATADRLARATINAFANDNWGFRGVARATGWTAIAIPLLPAGMNQQQSWLQRALHETLTDPNGEISPAPGANFNALLVTGGARASDNGYGPALDLLGLLRHPTRLNAANSDCVSCHIAPQAALFYEQRGVTLRTGYTPPDGFDPMVAVEPSLRGNLSNTIMFGWHRAGTVVSPGTYSIARRVAFETAEVLRTMGEL